MYEKENYANHANCSLLTFCTRGAGDFRLLFCGRFRLRKHCATGAAGLRATALPWRWIYLDSGLLGLFVGWLLLGAGHMGGRA